MSLPTEKEAGVTERIFKLVNGAPITAVLIFSGCMIVKMSNTNEAMFDKLINVYLQDLEFKKQQRQDELNRERDALNYRFKPQQNVDTTK